MIKKRTVDTSNIAFSKYAVIQDARLREANYMVTGLPHSKVKQDMEKHVDVPFPNGESYKDVEKRMFDFLSIIKKYYDGKKVAIVSHQAPQLALDVLLRSRTWAQAVAEDWRRVGKWQPGWKYVLE